MLKKPDAANGVKQVYRIKSKNWHDSWAAVRATESQAMGSKKGCDFLARRGSSSTRGKGGQEAATARGRRGQTGQQS